MAKAGFPRFGKNHMESMTPGDKINLLFITKPLVWSAAGRVWLDVAARLNSDRYHILYGLISSIPEEEIALPENLPVFRFPMRKLLQCMDFFLNLLRFILSFSLTNNEPGASGRIFFTWCLTFKDNQL
jgi:hypothetical protein